MALSYLAQEQFPSAKVTCENGPNGEVWSLEIGGQPTVKLGESREEALKKILELVAVRRMKSS